MQFEWDREKAKKNYRKHKEETRGQIFIVEYIPHNLLRERAKENPPVVQKFRLKGLKVKIL